MADDARHRRQQTPTPRDAAPATAGALVALGVSVFFGMILATVLGLVLTPSLYRMVQGLAERGAGERTGDA